MKTEFIPKFVTLLAGAIVCIISIVKHMDTTYSLEILLAVLIIFYFIGSLARWIIEKVMSSDRLMSEKPDGDKELEDIAAEKREQDRDETEDSMTTDGN